MKVKDALKAHEQWLRMRRSEGTAKKYAQLLKPFEKEYGDREIESLTASDLELGYLGQFASLAPASQRNRLAALKSLFDVAERFDWISVNPTRRLEPPARDEKMKPWLRPEQDEAVLRAAVKSHEQLIVFLLRFTGLRVSEACALKWSDVDLRNQSLTVHKSKTQSGKRVLPIPPLLVPILGYEKKRSEYVLSTKERHADEAAVRLASRQARRRAGRHRGTTPAHAQANLRLDAHQRGREARSRLEAPGP